MDLLAVAFAARCAVLQSRGDSSGIESLTREFISITGGDVAPDVVEELLRLSFSVLGALGVDVLAGMLQAVEDNLAGQLGLGDAQ